MAENQLTDLCLRSIRLWQDVPEGRRRACEKHLCVSIYDSNPEVFQRWAKQAQAGLEIGSDQEYWFHFAGGMAVRNVLRQVMLDDELPPVEQPGGAMASNWDDYYVGALHAALAAPPGALVQSDVDVSDAQIPAKVPTDTSVESTTSKIPNKIPTQEPPMGLPTADPERYFLDCDQDGHYFVVPVSRKTDWEEWCMIPSDDERGWTPPDFARSVGGSPTLVTFTDPEIS